MTGDIFYPMQKCEKKWFLGKVRCVDATERWDIKNNVEDRMKLINTGFVLKVEEVIK